MKKGTTLRKQIQEFFIENTYLFPTISIRDYVFIPNDEYLDMLKDVARDKTVSVEVADQAKKLYDNLRAKYER